MQRPEIRARDVRQVGAPEVTGAVDLEVAPLSRWRVRHIAALVIDQREDRPSSEITSVENPRTTPGKHDCRITDVLGIRHVKQ